METIGARLRAAREQKGISLADAQKALRIHPGILRALENDSAHKSLSVIYVRNFLRSYARYLGLDSEKIIEEYSALHREMPDQVLFIDPERERQERIRQYIPMAGKLIAGIVIAVFLVFFSRAVYQFAEYVKARVPVTVEKPKAPAHLERAKPKEEQKQKPKAAVTKKQQEKTVARTTQPKPAVKEPAAEKPTAAIPKDTSLTLITKAHADVWMEVKSDGELLSRNVLTKGSAETWKARERIELWVGKAEALELIVNGVSMGAPGKGVKRGIVVTRNGVKIP